MNLLLKEALEDALGQPGIGHNSQWQLEFMAKLFLDQLKEIYGKAKVDEMWSSIIEEIMNNPRFQKEGMRLGGKCFSKYYDDIQIKANSEPEKVMELLNKLPANLRDPVFSRWLTMLLFNNDFIDHFWTIYFLAIHIKCSKHHKSTSLARTYACQVLALMRIKSDAAIDDDESLPVIYVVLLFVRAFSRSWFFDHFNFRMRTNPHFGKGTYGFMSQYCPVHTYVMHRDLEQSTFDNAWAGSLQKRIPML
jgi:hypothetical protein